MEKLLYTVSEVAELLQCNASAVYKLKNMGLLRFLKLGRYKCRKETLEEFLKTYEGYDITDPENIRPLAAGEPDEADIVEGEAALL